MRYFLLFLFCSCAAVQAETVFFDRPEKPGNVRTAQIRLQLSREYQFLIPGMGKPLEKLETLEVVLLTSIKTEKVNAAGNPIEFIIEPKVVAGSVNGRAFDAKQIQDRQIRAETGSFPCRFSALDGKPLSPEAVQFLSGIFRVQPDDTVSSVIGREQEFAAGKKWPVPSGFFREQLLQRGFALKPEQIAATARFESKFKVGGIPCTAVVVECATQNTFDLEFRMKTRMILPMRPEDGAVLNMTREGIEVVDRKMASHDPMAAGTAVRVFTKEKMDVTYVQEKKAFGSGSSFFPQIFR